MGGAGGPLGRRQAEKAVPYPPAARRYEASKDSESAGRERAEEQEYWGGGHAVLGVARASGQINMQGLKGW
jgi:hypothetical protein